jgi:hypothetical protein
MNYIEKAETFLYCCIRKGLAHSYDVVKNKWVKPYPEVTGYLLSYLCRNNYHENELRKTADRLIGYQHKTGGFPSFFNKSFLYVFDTAQILIGLLELYKKTNMEKYSQAAFKAGEFLEFMQMTNGAFFPIYHIWKKEQTLDNDTYKIWNGPYSGIMCKLTECWSVLLNITKDDKYQNRINQTASFYKEQNDIEHTHPMGYFLEGLYAAGEYGLVKSKIEKLILPRLRDNGYIPYTENLPYAYVSGTIQLGILMFKCGYKQEARKVLEYGRLVQSKHTSGGLFQYADEKGNLDNHVHTEINSWGTKYFCELERLLNDI